MASHLEKVQYGL